MQPLIMTGLGTGAAPFRAFMQHRAMLSEKNVPVGPMYYYFGSRHRSQEYLYGEEVSHTLCFELLERDRSRYKMTKPYHTICRAKCTADIHRQNTKNSQLTFHFIPASFPQLRSLTLGCFSLA
jgi:sulfite reductase (NADPH) flavoprotein alpha-component